MYDLPKKINICGTEYGIRSDYRAVLDVCTALSDAELTSQEKSYVALDIFYPDFKKMPPEHYQEALRQCFLFINCGEEEENKKSPKLVDWAQDFNYIVAPVNRVMGREIRSVKYMHWWTFVGAYMEIGECTFAQIVRIRDRKAKGKPLDKQDAEWYRNNRNLVDLKHTYSDEEKGLLEQWGIK
ncbi:MAG: Gp15 family bacteriophage protein [Oscillibacter sp.]|nr:Gp15 family bacteriophage protein [Oscillibacter sp.]MEA4992348.1 Gp15 family bacteriophage protein [Oscillibacter sp.]